MHLVSIVSRIASNLNLLHLGYSMLNESFENEKMINFVGFVQLNNAGSLNCLSSSLLTCKHQNNIIHNA